MYILNFLDVNCVRFNNVNNITENHARILYLEVGNKIPRGANKIDIIHPPVTSDSLFEHTNKLNTFNTSIYIKNIFYLKK
jgi:hypothetical protein